MSNYYGLLYRGNAGASGGGGGGGGSVTLNANDYFHTVVDPADAAVTLSLTTAGDVTGTGVSTYAWLLSGAASDYEVKADLLSGSVSSGTTGSWLPLSSSRTWTRTRSFVGESAASLSVSIRRVSDSVVVAGPVTKNLTATVDT